MTVQVGRLWAVGPILVATLVAPAGDLAVGASAPVAPASCSPTTTSVANTTSADVPPSGVLTSSIDVSGLGSFIWDVDAITFINHVVAANLDVTVMSPEGTVVTLTTDNGIASANVFAGTVWDDSAAAPVGNGLVTDYAFVSGQRADFLVPEEAMSAFIGENPNGLWSLTVSDDAPIASGRLIAWGLDLTVLSAGAASRPRTFLVDANAMIPDDGGYTITSSSVVAAPDFGPIVDLDVRLGLTHTASADLDITLDSPGGGSVVTLTTDNGGLVDNAFDGTVWDDDADPGGQVPYSPTAEVNNGLVTDRAYMDDTPATRLVPEGALGAFNGESVDGMWTLSVTDDAAGDGGVISDWALIVRELVCSPGRPTSVSAVPADRQAFVSWTAPSIDGGAPISRYTVTASPGGRRCRAINSTSCVVTGLQNGTGYRFSVRANNGLLTSARSRLTAKVRPLTRPSSPRAVTAVAGNRRVTVSWRPPATNGGARVTRYQVRARPGGRTCSTAGTRSCVVTGLRNGTPYRFFVTATNAAGPGTPSQRSAPVTPRAMFVTPTAM